MSFQLADRIKLTSRKIYIIPTRWGVLYGIILLVILLLAINYKISLAYYLAFLLMAMGIVTIFHTWLNVIDLSVGQPSAKPVFAGDTAQISLRVQSNNGIRYAIGAYLSKKNMHFQDVSETAMFSIPLLAKQRGWQTIPRITLFSEYPLGLLHAWARIRHDSKLLVYPQPSKEQDIAIAFNAGEQSALATLTSTKKGDDDFNGHRNYQKGDSLKHVDWKASSKRDQLLSIEYAADLPEVLWFDWSRIEADNQEQRISLLTRAIIDAHAANKTYGLKLPKSGFEPDNSIAHYHACLKALALL